MVSKKIYVLVTALALVMLAAPAHAQSYQGNNGDIAYIKQNVLWRMAANGESQRKVAHGVRAMAWSPDGTRLAYITGSADCGSRLWISQDIHKKPADAARGGCIVGKPVWSPDGTQIAFTRAKGKDRAIMRLKLSEGFERAVTPWTSATAYQNPSWSPNASQIVYERHDATRSSLAITSLNGNVAREVTELSDYRTTAVPSWSPNGKKIAYQDSQNETYTIWPDGTHRSVIADGDSYQAVWSPTGDRLVFVEDFSGTSLSIATSDGSVEQYDIPDYGQASIQQPVWSPDEASILLVLGYEHGAALAVFNIRTMELQLLAKGATAAAWQST